VVALPDEYSERAAYVVSGTVSASGSTHDAGRMLVFQRGAGATLQAVGPAVVMLLGGEKV
jgi:redox-sensitive bicupin YhaK (pirin superfamily)